MIYAVRDTVMTFDVMQNDVSEVGLDHGQLRVVSANSENVRISVTETGLVLIEPLNGFTGTATFQYQITDLAGAVSQWVTSTVHVRASGGQNPIEPADVLNNGSVVPLDALAVLNAISRHRVGGSGALDVDTLRDSGVIDDVNGPFYDVNGDGEVTPLDALLVLIAIVRQRADGERVMGESESTEASNHNVFWQSAGTAGIDWLDQPGKKRAEADFAQAMLF